MAHWPSLCTQTGTLYIPARTIMSIFYGHLFTQAAVIVTVDLPSTDETPGISLYCTLIYNSDYTLLLSFSPSLPLSAAAASPQLLRESVGTIRNRQSGKQGEAGKGAGKWSGGAFTTVSSAGFSFYFRFPDVCR